MAFLTTKPVSKAYAQFCKHNRVGTTDSEPLQEAFFNGAMVAAYTLCSSDAIVAVMMRELVLAAESLNKDINYRLPERPRVEDSLTTNELYAKMCELCECTDTPYMYKAFIFGALNMLRLGKRQYTFRAALRELNLKL